MVILGRNTLISENAVGTRQSILATLHAWSAQEAKLRGGVYRVFTVIEPRSNCPGLGLALDSDVLRATSVILGLSS